MDIIVLLVVFIITFIILYILVKPVSYTVYPDINNYNDLLYIDEKNVCYKYNLVNVDC